MEDMMTMPKAEMKEDKNGGMITGGSWKRVANGFHYSVHTDKGNSQDYVYGDAGSMMKAMQDDMMSPHMRVPKAGTGKRFMNLTAKLSIGGAKNPKALAAYIGRKKFGKSRFQSLASKGKKKDYLSA